MPAADGSGGSNGRSEIDLETGLQVEMVPPGDRDGQFELRRQLPVGPSQAPERLVSSTHPQQPVAITPEVCMQLRAVGNKGKEIQEDLQPTENRQQGVDCHAGGAGASGGGSEPNQVTVQGSSQPNQRPVAIIRKVRERLRRVDSDLFSPQILPMGPYHQRKDSCSEKKKAVQDILGNNLTYLKGVLDELEVRKCYTDLPDDHYKYQESFTSMLLHDGCYLLSFFIDFGKQQEGRTGNLEGDGSGKDKQKIATTDSTLVRDILYLLENQIPMPVLEQILDHRKAEEEARSAHQFIAEPVKELLQKQLYISKMTQPQPPQSTPSDLLHLVYSYFRLPPRKEPSEPARPRSLTGRWRRASDYSRYANLGFKRRKFKEDEEWTILDIHLEGGTLYIPFLRVGSTTWTMLRNLMALEEHEEKQRPVTAYCYFMSQLACTEEDVGLLQRAKILEHFLGSDEQAAKGFAELCDGLALDIDRLDRNYLKPKWHKLERRCRKPMHNFNGFFREKYCGNWFRRSLFFIALFVFVCQVLQVVFAGLAYQPTTHNPPK